MNAVEERDLVQARIRFYNNVSDLARNLSGIVSAVAPLVVEAVEHARQRADASDEPPNTPSPRARAEDLFGRRRR